MSAQAITSPAVVSLETRLPAVILVGGCLNGFVVRVVEQISIHGFTTLSLGLSPFQLIALVVAARLVFAGSDGEPARLGLAEILTLAMVVAPSSTISWVAVAFYSIVHAYRTSGERRVGALLFLGIALCALWSSVILKWMATPITTAEAYILGSLVGLLRPDIVQWGNVVGDPQAHNLILMTACTTADGLPPAVLALISVAYFCGVIDPGRAYRACGALCALYAAANLLRLSAMAWSADGYDFMHGPIGSNVFDALQTAAVLILGNWASRA